MDAYIILIGGIVILIFAFTAFEVLTWAVYRMTGKTKLTLKKWFKVM